MMVQALTTVCWSVTEALTYANAFSVSCDNATPFARIE